MKVLVSFFLVAKHHSINRFFTETTFTTFRKYRILYFLGRRTYGKKRIKAIPY